ncbi:MAG: helix-turn-helix domain-containing protein [Alphaproteobacteria bacterium]|nr:helix-turn-helix domain-containing protein [Alphaproteobacteria bacterium]
MPRPVAPPLFRDRLLRVIERGGLSHSAFARKIGLDRSTLSQLLAPQNGRLPRAETLAAIATGCKVSVDWLLGLSQREEVGAELIEAMLQIERDAYSPVDARLLRWYEEAAGYKIRTVPASFPDLLKTEEVIHFEYAASQLVGAERTVDRAQARLAYLRRPDTDMEACAAVQAVTGFARGEAQWDGLPAPLRRAQIDHMIALCEELYPGYRLFLFDRRRTFSVPFTVFGQMRTAIYLGNTYLVLNGIEHIRMMSRQFDELVRAAIVQPHEIPRFLQGLRAEF